MTMKKKIVKDSSLKMDYYRIRSDGSMVCHPESPIYYVTEANNLCEDGLYFDALMLLEKAVARYPHNEQVNFNIAYVYEEVGNFKGAIKHFLRCINYPFSKSNLASTYAKIGDYVNAIKYAQEALREVPTDGLAIDIISFYKSKGLC